jgi:hypothetical protein
MRLFREGHNMPERRILDFRYRDDYKAGTLPQVDATIHRRFLAGVPELSGRVAAAIGLGRLLALSQARPDAWPPMPELNRAVAAGGPYTGAGSNPEARQAGDPHGWLRAAFEAARDQHRTR